VKYLANEWFALQVKLRKESCVAVALSRKGYEYFLPLAHQYGSKVISPLFPGYLFCRLSPQVVGPIVTTPGVIRIVGFGGRAVPIAEDEILSIRRVVESSIQHDKWPFVSVGDLVEIIEGPLAGLRGFVYDFRGRRRIIVSISLLMRSVAVDLHDYDVRMIAQASREACQVWCPGTQKAARVLPKLCSPLRS
jgi:transcription antitermination factor NusG